MKNNFMVSDAFFLSCPGPFLGLDVGDARIGVSVSDPTALIARPLDTIQRTPRKGCLDRLEALVRETGATGLVVGLPLLESGVEGEQAEKTRAFLRSANRRIPSLPVTWWDERYTTGGAKDLMAGKKERDTPRGKGPKRSGARGGPDDSSGRSRRDELAATLLLQEWLDERRRRQSLG